MGRVPFESFLFDYVQTFKYKSISSDDFVRYFTAYFTEGRHALPRVSTSGVPPLHTGSTGAPDPEDISALCVLNEGDAPVPSAGVSTSAAAAVHAIDVSAVDWEAWLHGVGGPPVKNTYEDTVRGLVSAHADLWVSDPAAAAGACGAITADWAATQWMAFMERLVEVSSALGARSPRAIIAPSTLRSLDAAVSDNSVFFLDFALHIMDAAVSSSSSSCSSNGISVFFADCIRIDMLRIGILSIIYSLLSLSPMHHAHARRRTCPPLGTLRFGCSGAFSLFGRGWRSTWRPCAHS